MRSNKSPLRVGFISYKDVYDESKIKFNYLTDDFTKALEFLNSLENEIEGI